MKGSLYPTVIPTGSDSVLGVQASGPNTKRFLNSDFITLVANNIPSAQGTFAFVSAGLVWSGDAYASTRAASMTSGTVKVNTTFLSIGAVTSRIFTASKDTYVDILDNLDGTGTIVYTEVTNNASSPALAPNSVRLAIIITGASNIASAGSINQGQESSRLPVASTVYYTVCDSLGNLICPRDPNRKLLGYRVMDGDQSTATSAAIAQLTCPINVPLGRKTKAEIVTQDVKNTTAASGGQISIWDGTPFSGTKISESDYVSTGASQNIPLTTKGIRTPSSSTPTYNGGLAAVTTSFAVIQATSVLIIELE